MLTVHYQRWVCAGESRALTQSLVLWDVFKGKLDVPKNPAVTNSSSPTIPVLGLLGSAARPGTPHGLVPDQSTAGVTCCPSPLHGHTGALSSRDAQGFAFSLSQASTETLRLSQNPALLQSPSCSSSSGVLKI